MAQRWCLWLALAFLLSCGPEAVQLAEAQSARKSSRRSRRWPQFIGDLSLRLGLGLSFFSGNTESGQWTAKPVGERGIFEVPVSIEYGYFVDNTTAIIFSLPSEFESNPIISTNFSIGLGVGVRKYFLRFFYVSGELVLLRFTSSDLSFRFGGLLFGVGGALPISPRLRVFLTAQAPLSFYLRPGRDIQSFFPYDAWLGLRVSFNAIGGVEILF